MAICPPPEGCAEESSILSSFRATRRLFLPLLHEWTVQTSSCPTSKSSKHSLTNQSVVRKEWDPVAQMFVQNKTSNRALGVMYFYMFSQARAQRQRSSLGLWKERHEEVYPSGNRYQSKHPSMTRVADWSHWLMVTRPSACIDFSFWPVCSNIHKSV